MTAEVHQITTRQRLRMPGDVIASRSAYLNALTMMDQYVKVLEQRRGYRFEKTRSILKDIRFCVMLCSVQELRHTLPFHELKELLDDIYIELYGGDAA